MLKPSTITALRTRRYDSTWYIPGTIHRFENAPNGWRKAVQFSTADCQSVNPPTRSNLPPPITRALASLVVVNGNPTTAIAPPWSAVLEVSGVITLILATLAYWRLVYRHLKRSVQRRLTRATPVEQPTLDSLTPSPGPTGRSTSPAESLA